MIHRLVSCSLLVVTAFALTACRTAAFDSKSSMRKGATTIPNTPTPGPAVDCTNLSEQQCLQKKRDENTTQSFRTVDCSDKAQAACDQLTQQAKVTDGSANSDIRIVPCQQANDCGESTANTPGTSTGTDTTTTPPIDNGGFNDPSDIKFCAGGPVNAPFAFKTIEEARTCCLGVRRGGVNDAKECPSDARFGHCKFNGTVEQARRLRSPRAVECNCLRQDIQNPVSPVWSATPAKCGEG